MSKPIAIQLFSLRDQCAADLEGTLSKLKEFGYDGVEPYDPGFYGRTAKEFKAILNKYELTCPSFHCSLETYIRNGVEKTCEDMLIMEPNVVAFPYIPSPYHPFEDKWDETREYIEKILSVYSKEGVKLLFHNHPNDGYPINDKSRRGMQDVIFEDTEVMPEADTAWLICNGIKPSCFFKRYNGRVPAIHIKDFTYFGRVPKQVCEVLGREYVWDDDAPSRLEFATLGQGLHDVAETVKLAVKAGCENFIVEQDNPTPGLDQFECAKRNLEFLRSFEF